MTGFIKKLIRSFVEKSYIILSRSGITYAKDLLYTYNNADFLHEPRFLKAYGHVKCLDETGITGDGIEWRIHVLCWAAEHASKLEGDFVDCGVNTGLFSRAVIDYVDFMNLGKTYYLLDTFSGMDPRYSSSYEMARHHTIGYDKNLDLYEKVKETFHGLPVKIIKGAIPDTLDQVDTRQIAYLSVDMNCVLPEVAALEFFWDRMVHGGVIILDDYGYPGAEDQKAAHDKFAQAKGVQILSLPTCQGLIIKP